jgi:DNA-binding MarR family transcriptional regulator
MRRTSTKPIVVVGKPAAKFCLDDQIGFLLRRAYQRASAMLVSRIAEYNLTPPQFSVLARLYERGSVSQNLLGRLVAMEPANIRDVVLRLKKRRLIRAERNALDGRLILLSLTSLGVSLVQTLLPLEIASTAASLASIRPGERELLIRLLRRFADGPQKGMGR